jgi:two-component system sensor histidine kinase RpfC
VQNGEEALDALEHGRFDLALLDLSMPILSGIQALRSYRFTSSKPIPILILSANVTQEIIADCRAAGCAEFVSKPLRASTLLDAVERHLALDSAAVPPPPRSDDAPSLSLIDTPIVDSRVINDLENLSPDPTFVGRLVAGFRGDADRILTNIAEALLARRFEDARNCAHALKGGAGSVGALQLMQIAARLEGASHETLRTKAVQLIDELDSASRDVFNVLDQHLSDRRGPAVSGDPDR